MYLVQLMITILAALLAMLFIASLFVRRTPALVRMLSLLTIALVEGGFGFLLMVIYHLYSCPPNNDFCPFGYFYYALGLGILAAIVTLIVTLVSVASLVRARAWLKGLLVLALGLLPAMVVLGLDQGYRLGHPVELFLQGGWPIMGTLAILPTALYGLFFAPMPSVERSLRSS